MAQTCNDSWNMAWNGEMISGNGWNGMKGLKRAGNVWKWLELAGDAGNGWK